MSTPEIERPAGAATTEKIRTALRRYQVMAWATGIWLILLCAELYLKYVAHSDLPVGWIPRVHGFVYFVYVLAAFDLAIKVRWAPGKILWVLLAGTIPVVGVVVEHFQNRNIKAQFEA
ncbi:DUF3817 domain-containing protein [Mycobacterium sp. M1]|uniref:DUF3817 domain-containing protein n=1 Tax=Mycolicibacter acidiphilus TaxID=2835306 RepID=A0ABS5RND3_9MYCO|nr:DUF3817 domain-containing protein [Mycolicibacter acidiphilus]MBS9535805.1 DUF3817 domain-containing protein [Mycolicibacter acidiphilus]